MCRPLALVLVLVAFVVTAGSISWFNLLGEAPDEAAHMHLIRFISERGHPPRSHAEREAAGYKSDTPMLYHILIGMALRWVDYAALPRLKEYSTDPRRLLIADGLPPSSVVHTEDETFPFHGVVLAWHLARLISLLLSTATVVVVYTTTRAARLYDETLALGAAALIATNAQFTFIASAVNDDNLLGLLSALFTWGLILAWRRPMGIKPYAMAGICLGLAITTKYSVALFPLLVAVLLTLAVRNGRLDKRAALVRFCVFIAAFSIAAAWWFIFVLWHFNEVRQLGWLAGLVRPFMGGARADASLQQVASFLTGGALPGSTEMVRPAADWLSWLGQMFISFWMPGSPLDHPLGSALCIGVACLTALTLAGLLRIAVFRRDYRASQSQCASTDIRPYPYALLVLQVLLLLPFPILRYILTGNVIETAQGRHILFAAVVPIGLLLATGLASWFKCQGRQRALLGASGLLLSIGWLNFYGVMAPAFPEPLPVRTTADAIAQVANPLHLSMHSAVELLGYEVHSPNALGALPVTLIWRSTGDSSEDFLTDLFLIDADGDIYARWLGHPAGGRYPTRAWQPGDVIRDEIWPVVASLRAGTHRLCLRLMPVTATSCAQPTADEAHCLTALTLPDVPTTVGRHTWQLPDGRSGTFDIWQAGRTDDPLPVFRYRATIQVSVNAQSSEGEPYIVTLVGPDEVEQIAWCRTDDVHTFLVDARWSAGRYRVQLRSGEQSFTSEPVLEVRLRQRNFSVPPMQHVVNARFGGEITLLGYDLPQRRVQPGGALPITLYWRAERDVQRHYIVFNHLLGADLRQWGGRDRIPRDYYSTALWTAGEVVRDDYLIPVDAAAPPGVYRLDVGLYQTLRGQIYPLWLVDAEGDMLNANSVTLTTIKVGGAPPGVTVSGTPSLEHPRADGLSGLVTLIGYDLVVRPTHIEVVLYWRCDASLPADYTTFVHLTKAGTADIVAQMDRPPADGRYPTSLWDIGEVIRDAVMVPLPTDLPPDKYDILVGLYDSVTGQRLAITSTTASDSLQDAIRLTTLRLPAGTTDEVDD